jgi:hypothetical protein|tara:strand:+ start:259 stop:492 length:234 start_codon:yes stop_codon:yes gene_type:complete
MPSYTLRNIKTKEERDVFCSYTELLEILKEDPTLVQKLTTPKIVSGVGSLLSKTDDGWKDHLKEIKKGSGRDNTIKV